MIRRNSSGRVGPRTDVRAPRISLGVVESPARGADRPDGSVRVAAAVVMTIRNPQLAAGSVTPRAVRKAVSRLTRAPGWPLPALSKYEARRYTTVDGLGSVVLDSRENGEEDECCRGCPGSGPEIGTQYILWVCYAFRADDPRVRDFRVCEAVGTLPGAARYVPRNEPLRA